MIMIDEKERLKVKERNNRIIEEYLEFLKEEKK